MIEIIIWLSLGFVGAGFFYADMQRSFPKLADAYRVQDTVWALAFIFGGPCIILAAMVMFFTGELKGWLAPGSKP